MTLPVSGTISLANIASEFKDSTPYSMSEFYRGGGRVMNTPSTINIPLSGEIKFSNFYGAQNYFTYNETISTNTVGYSLYTKLIAAGWNGTATVNANITIPAGVWVYGNNDWAFTISDSIIRIFPANSAVNIVLNGNIVGQAGVGMFATWVQHNGAGSYNYTQQEPSNGLPAINFNSAGPDQNGTIAIFNGVGQNGPRVTITGNGIIGGGGGGGGAGGTGLVYGDFGDGLGSRLNACGGGGGGAGAGGVARFGGNGGYITGVEFRSANGVPGKGTGNIIQNSATMSLTPGSGGVGNSYNWTVANGSVAAAGNGGSGGGLGSSGSAGTNGYDYPGQFQSTLYLGRSGGPAGPAMAYANSIPNLTIAGTIQVFGAIVPGNPYA